MARMSIMNKVNKPLRRLLALLLAAVLALACPAAALAEGENDEDLSPAPVTIATVADLLQLAEDCRLDTWSQNRTVTLTADLDLADSDFAGIPTFGGVFDGGGHTISGLNLTVEGSTQGFFRYVQEGALVKDLNLSGSVAPGGSKSTVGGLAGDNAGTLQNCSFAGIVTGSSTVGGMVGQNQTTGVVYGCTVNGVVYGSHFIGGLAGDNHGVVTGCVNRADVNTTAAENTVDLDALTLDSITGSSHAADITDIGGIAGCSSGVVRACQNYGTVGYQHVGYNVGGIAGSQTGYVVNCRNYGSVYARKEGGGIVGQLEPSSDLEYTPDTLQIVSGQLYTLQSLTDKAASDAAATNSALTGQLNALQSQVGSAHSAVETLLDRTVDGISVSTQEVTADLSALDADVTLTLPSLEVTDQDGITAARNDLSGTLTGIYGTVGSLNSSTGGNAAALVSDIQAIADQINRIGQTLAGAGDNDTNIFQDVSDQDSETDTTGKVAACLNRGAVQADINAGGIAGAMAQENDLDPEDDLSVAGDASLNFTMRSRAVLRDCRNEGVITAQKRCAGGIVGAMEMGAAQNCLNLGTLDAEEADSVGGIAGTSSATLRACCAKCDLAGATQVGGIAGSGYTITDCRALVRITGGTEQLGAIAGTREAAHTNLRGETDEEDTPEVSGNYYVCAPQSDIGGIDGVSYAGVAEPLPYADFTALEDLPAEFAAMTLRFVGQDDTQAFTVAYGAAFDESDIPAVPEKNGQRGSWEGLAEADLTAVYYDETFTAAYAPLLTTLASSQTRTDGRAVALLEGSFAAEAPLLADYTGENAPTLPDGQTLLEQWALNLPEDAADDGETDAQAHTLRYLPPDGSDAAHTALYLQGADGSWRPADATADGSYLVAQAQPGDTALAAAGLPAADYTLPVAAALAALCLLLVALRIARRRKHRKAKAKAK